MESINQWMYRVMDAKKFNGTPKLYKKFSRIITAILMTWIYLGFVLIKYFVQGENWFSVWQFPATLLVIGVLFSRYYFNSMMRLDAQFGKGSGWKLTEKTVKLPEMRERKK